MLKIKQLAALATLAIGMTAANSASADRIYNLSNVTLSTAMSGGMNAGTLTGSFTTNDARSTVISYNITASAAGSFLGFNYNSADSSVTASSLPSQYFQIDSAGSINELRLYFTSGLSASGGTISSAFSYENEPSGGNRFLSGSVVAAMATPAVPEAATWAMMMVGLGVVGGSLRRRGSVSTRVQFA